MLQKQESVRIRGAATKSGSKHVLLRSLYTKGAALLFAIDRGRKADGEARLWDDNMFSLLLTADFNAANEACAKLRGLGLDGELRRRLDRFNGAEFELRLVHAPLPLSGLPRATEQLDNASTALGPSTVAVQYRPLDPAGRHQILICHQLGLLWYEWATGDIAILLAVQPDGSVGSIFLCAMGGHDADGFGDPHPFARELPTFPPTDRFTLAEVCIRLEPGGTWAYAVVPRSREEVAVSATAQPVSGGPICPDPRLHDAVNSDGDLVTVWAWHESDFDDGAPIFKPVVEGGCRYWG